MRKTLLPVLAALLLPALAAAQSQNRYLAAAMKLYGDLEYEAALTNLEKAQKQPGNSMAEDVQISLYKGLIEFELGQSAAAESDFKAALALDETLALPASCSPKVATLFEKARRDILKARPPKPVVKTPPPAEPAPSPTLAVASPVVPLTAPTPLPPAEVRAPATGQRRILGLAVGLPLLAIGAGLAGGGGYFGSQSSGAVADARAATYQSDAQRLLDQAGGHARNANIMYGVGAAVAVAGAVTLIATLATRGDGAPLPEGDDLQP